MTIKQALKQLQKDIAPLLELASKLVAEIENKVSERIEQGYFEKTKAGQFIINRKWLASLGVEDIEDKAAKQKIKQTIIHLSSSLDSFKSERVVLIEKNKELGRKASKGIEFLYSLQAHLKDLGQWTDGLNERILGLDYDVKQANEIRNNNLILKEEKTMAKTKSKKAASKKSKTVKATKPMTKAEKAKAIEALLRKLAKTDDQDEKRELRKQLRKLGHKGGLGNQAKKTKKTAAKKTTKKSKSTKKTSKKSTKKTAKKTSKKKTAKKSTPKPEVTPSLADDDLS